MVVLGVRHHKNPDESCIRSTDRGVFDLEVLPGYLRGKYNGPCSNTNEAMRG
jgi:hypothetical protein